MIDDLSRPTLEVARVIDAVAEGDLSQKMQLKIEGRAVKGEFLRIGTTVNSMVDQLSSFADEVTRVAREVGTEGKLGGQATVKGVSGTWKDLTDNVNGMASNLTSQVRNIAEVTTAVANGDLTRKITVDVKGEVLELKNTINTMVDQLSTFADEVTRVAREAGTEGKLGGQAVVKGVGGTWKDLTDNVNLMVSNLTTQVRGVAQVVTAVADGDLNRKFTIEAKGEVAALAETVNAMVDRLRVFSAEVTRVAREVGSEGKLGGAAEVEGVSGVWRGLTESVNGMADNLTQQVRNIAEVTTAVAQGDLTRKITVDAKGEILRLKNTINTMVDQLSSFADEVTRVAREVGTEGQLGGQANVKGVSGTWKDLTDNVNFMATNLTTQVRGIAKVVTAVADGDLNQKFTIEARGEVASLADTINAMIDTLRLFADQVTGVAREVGTEGVLGGQADVPNAVRHVEGAHRQRELDGEQPDDPGAQHRRGDDGGRARRPQPQDHRAGEGRGRRARRDDQHDGRPALVVRRRGDARRARGRRRRPPRRPGRGARRLRRLARADRQRQPDGAEPHRPGPEHRRRDDRGREGRPLGEDRRRGGRRVPRPEEHDQHDDRPALGVRRRGDARRARGRLRGHPRRLRAGRGRLRRVARADGVGERHGRQPHEPGAQHRRGDDRGRKRRPLAQDHRPGEGRGRRARRHDQHDGRAAERVRRRGDARRPRGRHRGPARRPGEGRRRAAASGAT